MGQNRQNGEKTAMRRENILIAVIDGQGGGMGRALVELAKRTVPDLHVRALGTNALATGAMLKAGADDGATGEGAVVYSAARAHILLGPVGILTPNGLLGEVTPAMAAAVGTSDAVKILLPSQRCSIRLAVSGPQTLQAALEEAGRLLLEETERLTVL